MKIKKNISKLKPKENYKEWLKIASDDLANAQHLFNLKQMRTSAFYCQQCIEKILKAYLVYKKIHVNETNNDLVDLASQCKTFDPTFNKIIKHSNDLKPYIDKFQYPNEHEAPGPREIETSIDKAIKTYNFTKKKIDEFEKIRKFTKNQKKIDE